MSVTAQEIYDRVCEVLLENGGLVLGLFTQAQFLDSLAVVLLDFSQRAALDEHIYTEMISAGVSEYIVPDDVMEVHSCYIGGKLIERTSQAELETGHFEWKRQWDIPRQWHEDEQDVKQITLWPVPSYNGTNIPGSGPPYGKYTDTDGSYSFFPSERNLTIVGPAAPTKTTWAITDTLDSTVPDAFAPYIVYGVLEKIFSSENECRDVARAHYCRTRWQEGLALVDAIAREELLEEDDA